MMARVHASEDERRITMNTESTVITDVVRGIDLPPNAAYFATWKDTPSLPRPAALPFDKAECLRRLGRVREHEHSNPDWREAEIAPTLTPAEANFWLAVVAHWCEGYHPANIPHTLKNLQFRGPVDQASVPALFQRQHHRFVPRELAAVLANIYGLVPFLARLAAGEFRTPMVGPYWPRPQNEVILVRGAWEFVRPYLTPAELTELRDLLRPQLDPATWPKKYDDPNALPYHVAALAGMHNEIRELVRGWKSGLTAQARNAMPQTSPLLVLLGLRDPALVDATARDIGLSLSYGFDLQAWLAHTGLLGVRLAAEQIVRQRYCPRQLLDELTRVKDPALAPHMLAIRVRSRNPAPARAWLETNVGSAVAGLLPLVLGKDKMALAAIEYLRDTAKRGYGWVIERELATADPLVVGKVHRAVLDRPERVVPEFAPADVPRWLTDALGPTRDLPDWLNPATLPPIRVGDRRLSTTHVVALLGELRAVQATKDDLFGNPAPLSDAVRKHATLESCDAFTLALFQRWLSEKSPHADNWVLAACGRLGDNATADALAPRLKRWPGGSSLRRFRDGLAALRRIGTPFAIGQLGQLTQTLPHHRARQIALEELTRLATARRLSVEQLEDRSTPDLGLAAGGPIFDYGPRQFRLVLADNLRPMARDAKGKSHYTLPTPRKSDDALLVAEARGAFRLGKAQATDVIANVCLRLERGLVHQRRWTLDDFDQYLLRHPVTGAVTRRLVWGWFGVDGSLTGTFRVTAEGEIVDADDRPTTANAFQVGLVHPVQLTADLRQTWVDRFADYELISPFAQLMRPVFDLTEEEAAATELTRFNFQSGLVHLFSRQLKEQGWQRRHGEEAHRLFPTAGVTAVVKWHGWERTDFVGCRFVPGPDNVPRYGDPRALPLGQVDEVVRCETLADLTQWARAAGLVASSP